MDLAGISAIVAINITLMAWIRNDTRKFESEIRGWKDEINKEMKDFHRRLCAIEERNKKGD